MTAGAADKDAAAPPFVSVVIPHLNQLDAADRCLRSLGEQSYPADRIEIILVDNGSSADPSALKARHPRVQILHEPRPGPGLARNRGVEAAKGELLIFIDADCRAAPGWIAAAAGDLTSAGTTGVVGGDVRIDFVDPARLTALEAYEAVFAFRQKLYIEQHGYSGTGNLAMLPEVFQAVGPFGGIGIAEDMDWGRRARAAGRPARYRPDMLIYHPARRSFAELEGKWRRHVAHQLAEHRLQGQPAVLWFAKAVAVLLSALPHSFKLLASDRLSGSANRLRGLNILYRIRWFRFTEMIAQARHDDNAAAGWNRPTA